MNEHETNFGAFYYRSFTNTTACRQPVVFINKTELSSSSGIRCFLHHLRGTRRNVMNLLKYWRYRFSSILAPSLFFPSVSRCLSWTQHGDWKIFCDFIDFCICKCGIRASVPRRLVDRRWSSSTGVLQHKVLHRGFADLVLRCDAK